MSERVEPIDQLWWKKGGKAPFFYAFCSQYWAALGNLVQVSPDPLATLISNPSALPRVKPYILHHERTGLSDPTKPTNEVRLLMASWERRIKQSSGPPDRECRFAIVLHVRSTQQEVEQRFTREYLIGKHATLQTTHSVQGDKAALWTRRGISRGEVRNLKSLMTGSNHANAVRSVEQLRTNSQRRADEIVSQFVYEPSPSDVGINILDDFSIGGQNIVSTIQQVSNLRILERSQLTTTGERDLLHDRFLLAGASVVCIQALGMSSGSTAEPQQQLLPGIY